MKRKYAECFHHGGVDDLAERDHAYGAKGQGNQRDAYLGDRVESLRLVMEHLDDLG